MTDRQEEKFSADKLYRAADAVWVEASGGRFLGGLLKDALVGKEATPLTIDEVRTAVETVYNGRFPENAALPTAGDTIAAAISALREALEHQEQSERPLDGITVAEDWTLPENWEKVEIIDTSIEGRRRDEMGHLETLLGVRINVMEQNDRVVTRYVISRLGGQTALQRELLADHIKKMSPPSKTHAIIRLEGRPQPTTRIMQGVPLPETLPEDWAEIEIGATAAFGIPKVNLKAYEAAWGVTIRPVTYNAGDNTVVRYVLTKGDGHQSTMQKERLAAHLKKMASPSHAHAILRIEAKPQTPQPEEIMQGIPLPELLPENWKEIEIAAKSALGLPTAYDEEWGVDVRESQPPEGPSRIRRYIISRRDKPQSTTQKRKLMDHLQAMAFPSASHAILRID